MPHRCSESTPQLRRSAFAESALTHGLPSFCPSGPNRKSKKYASNVAFGGKAEMAGCGCLLSRSLLGVKRTLAFAPHMSAYDPKRTSDRPLTHLVGTATMAS